MASRTVAIIGLAGRFPHAQGVGEFWQNLKEGRDCVTVLGHGPNGLVYARGLLGDSDLFDAAFFDLSPREAEYLNPQHRLFLECAWAAFENAGYDVLRHQGVVSVYSACGVNTYHGALGCGSQAEEFLAYISNFPDFLPTRVSHKLNLRGESVAVQTACSSSLVAVHLACQSLLNGDSDMAVAGGVNVATPSDAGYQYQTGGMYAPDGKCRAFDHRAAGYVPGDGVGVVVLKRLPDAERDGDFIYAVIKGSAVNNDGRTKIAYTAPSVAGQAEVIATALGVADVSPATIGLVEAHGTATPLGDPIEVAALTRAFRMSTDASGFCAIGSVKTNIGHAIHAAGIAGLIKAILSLQQGLIPPSLHFEKPNPDIDFANTPFYVNTSLRAWGAQATPRRAGVSSLGIGGTNAHVVLEQAPERGRSPSSRSHHLLVLSAKTASALDTAAHNLSGHVTEHPDTPLADVAYTLQIGRSALPRRRMLVVRGRDDAVETLPRGEETDAVDDVPPARGVVFMYSGQGTQYVDMGRDLYAAESVFREEVDRCAEILRPDLDLDIRDVLYPRDGHIEDATRALHETPLAQPAIFTIEYALTSLWMRWGVSPSALIGHSLGEYVAACVAGVLSLEDALGLVARRARLMEKLPAGAMLAVPLTEDDLRPWLRDGVSLALVNGPSFCVLAGPVDAVGQIERDLRERKVFCSRLQVSHAVHSPAMAPIVGPLATLAAKVTLKPPRLPLISNVTGTWMTAEQATNPHYWASHVQHTVRYAAGLERVFADPEQVLLEVGPGTLLTALARTHPARSSAQGVVPSLRPATDRQSDVALLLNAVGELWLRDIPIDWPAFHGHERRQRVPLPTYPFERKRYWAAPATSTVETALPTNPRTETKLPITEWWSAPAWRRSRLPAPCQPGDLRALGRHWLVFVNGTAFDSALVSHLRREAGLRVVTVAPGDEFRALGPDTFVIDPDDEEQYRALLDHVTTDAGPVDVVAHLWRHRRCSAARETVAQAQRLGFYSLLALAKALGRSGGAVSLWVVTSNAQAVADTNDRLDIGTATMLGLANVIPQEYATIRCCSLDFSDADLLEADASDGPLARLLSELADPSGDAEVAYRGRQRWVPTPQPLRSSDPSVPPPLRENGVYLITGGLGHVGSCIGEYLARSCRAKLVLTGRSSLPAEHLWPEWIAMHGEGDPLSQRILRVRRLRGLGAEVIVRAVDVADREAMARLIEELGASRGGLHGVIHAAGVVDSGHLRFIDETTPHLASETLRPHVAGTAVLDEVLQNHPIDFCVLVSSLSSFVGGLTYGAHAAGHRFMDALAQARARCAPGAPRWITINYDTWRVDSRDRRRLGSGAVHLNLTAEEGAEVFARCLSLPRGQWFVSTTALSGRMARARRSFDRLTPARDGVLPSGTPPASAPRDPVEIEDVVRRTVQGVLGTRDVHADDNFFALGGASLLFLDVITRLDHTLGIRLPLVEAFRALTVTDLAALCARCLVTGAPDVVVADR